MRPQLVLDFAFLPLPKEQLLPVLKANNVVGLCRYVKFLPNDKAITKAEYDFWRSNGIGVALNAEQSEMYWQGGADAGARIGDNARKIADSLGHESHLPIYLSYDANVGPGDAAVCAEHQRAFNAAAGGFPQGAYGDQYILDMFRRTGLAAYFWQSNAQGWYGTHKDWPDFAHLIQRFRRPFANLNPASIDVNDVIRTDWGQTGQRAPATPATPKKGRHMGLIFFYLDDAPASEGGPSTGWRSNGLHRAAASSEHEFQLWQWMAALQGQPPDTCKPTHLTMADVKHIAVAS